MATDQMQDLLRALSPEGSASALAGPAPWRQLSEQFDRLLMGLALPVLGSGRALVALGAYGRGELTRWSELELLILAPANAEDVVRAVISPLWDEHISTVHRIHAPNQLADRDAGPADVLPLLDARFVCGDPAAFVTFDSARRVLIARMQRPLRDEIARRHRERVAREPWQGAEPDLFRARGGLDAYVESHRNDTIQALIEERHPPAVGDPTRPLTEPAEVLLRALFTLHAQPGDRQDQLTQANAEAAHPQVDVRDVLLAMRDIDRVATEQPASVSHGWGATLMRGLGRLMGGGSSVAVPTAPPSDLAMLLESLRSDGATLDPLRPAPWQVHSDDKVPCGRIRVREQCLLALAVRRASDGVW